MAQGGFTLSLNKQDTPNTVINTVDAWGHIVIVPADLNPQEYSDSTLLSAASYVGIVESLELGLEEDVQITGTGLVSYLGDSETRGMPISQSGGQSGVRSYKNKTLEDTLDSTGTPKGLLRLENGSQGPIRKGTITEPTDSSTYTGKHYTESALKAIRYVCQDLDVEFKIDTQGYLSAGPKESLFSGHTTDPTSIIVRDGSGQDPNIDGINTTSLVAQFNAAEFVSSVELIASKYGKEANIGSASASSVPYKDLFGSNLVRTQYVSDPGTQGTSKNERATAYLNELNLVKKTINVSLEEYDIDGDFEVGDKIFIFDPDIGFMDTEADRIEDGRSSLYETIYQGQVLNPTKIRVLGITWPIKQGYGVFYRDKDGNYTELTDYCMWESGDVQIEIGDVAPTISEQLGFSGYTVDSVGGPDKSIPDQPVNAQGNNGIDTLVGTYSDGNGVSKAFIKITWGEPNNTDGTSINDGAYYRIRWRVVQDTDGNNIIDENDNQATDFVYSNVDFDTRQFIIYDLSPNTYYSVGVQTVDLSGFTSDYSSVASLQTPSDAGAPNKPDGFATIASNPLRVQFIHNLGQAKDSNGNAVSPVVNFTLAKDLSHLNIYASTTQGFDLQYNSTTKKVTQTGFKIGELVATSAHIQNEIAAVGYIDLDNGDTHYFRVTAVDSSGNESEPSDEQTGNADLVDSANIANLAVTNALIANAAITDLKVADVSAGKVTAGTISGQTIILDASGDTGNDSIIKSSNYSAGSTGWAITSDGTAEFRNATIRGSLNASDITAGTLSSDRLDTSFIAVGGAASDVNSGSTTIDGGNITTNSITTNQLNFTPFQDGDDLTSGSLGGITIDSDNIRTTNYSSNAGFRIESDGDAFFNDVTARGTISGTVDTSLSGGSNGIIQSSTGANRVKIGAALGAAIDFIYSSGTRGIIEAVGTDTFRIYGYEAGDDIQIFAGGLSGQGDMELKAEGLTLSGSPNANMSIYTPVSTRLVLSGDPGTAGQVLQSNANGMSWEDGTGHTHGNLSFPNAGTVLSSSNHSHGTPLESSHENASNPHDNYLQESDHNANNSAHSSFLTNSNHSHTNVLTNTNHDHDDIPSGTILTVGNHSHNTNAIAYTNFIGNNIAAQSHNHSFSTSTHGNEAHYVNYGTGNSNLGQHGNNSHSVNYGTGNSNLTNQNVDQSHGTHFFSHNNNMHNVNFVTSSHVHINAQAHDTRMLQVNANSVPGLNVINRINPVTANFTSAYGDVISQYDSSVPEVLQNRYRLTYQDVKQAFEDDGHNTDDIAYFVEDLDYVESEAKVDLPEGETMKGLMDGELEPVLVQAIKDLSAKIETLETRIATLEG